ATARGVGAAESGGARQEASGPAQGEARRRRTASLLVAGVILGPGAVHGLGAALVLLRDEPLAEVVQLVRGVLLFRKVDGMAVLAVLRVDARRFRLLLNGEVRGRSSGERDPRQRDEKGRDAADARASRAHWGGPPCAQ